MTIGADRQRQAWDDLPAEMRAAAASVLGSPIVGATTQNGGFSPGSADRVVTASGRRAFVKTAIADHNEESAESHEREARIVAALGPELPVPALLGASARDGWVVAVYEEIVGRHPETPWRADELVAVFDAFERITRHRAPDDLERSLPSAADALGTDGFAVAGWARVSAALIDSLEHRELVREMLSGPIGELGILVEELRGDRLLHLDARADNILIREDGAAVIVDWPYACIGAAWVDPLSLLVDVAYLDPEADVRALLAHPVLAGLVPDTIRRFFFQLAGHFLAKSELPEPPGIPGLRAFQREEGVTCLRLVRAFSDHEG